VDGTLVASSLGLGLSELPYDDLMLVSREEEKTIFESLTESLLVGESDSCLLQEEKVKRRVARGERRASTVL